MKKMKMDRKNCFHLLAVLFLEEGFPGPRRDTLPQVKCAHTEVRLCIEQLSCVCPWTNGKKEKKKNKERKMSVYNDYVMYILSRVENWEYLHLCSTADACQKAVSCHHLSAVIVRSIRNIRVRTTIGHIQISRRVLRCVIPTSVAHLVNINRQLDHLCVKRFSK